MSDASPSQLTGNLSTMNLADLLQWICLGHKTGTLHLQSGRIKKQVYILEGKLVSAGSNISRERLGQFLLHHGRITESALRAALSDQRSSEEPLGEILCRMNLLDRGQMQGILRLKAEETIYDLFLWDEGNFHFVADELPEWSKNQISLDVTGLIMEGVRRKDEMGLIRQTLPTNRVLLAVNEQRSSDADALTGFDQLLVSLVREGLTVAEISDRSRAPEFVLLRRLHEFVEEGLLRVEKDLSDENTTPDQLSFDQCLELCHRSLAAEDLQTAIDCLNAVQEKAPGEPGGERALADLEKKAAELIYSSMISPTHIPKLKRSMAELVDMEFNAEEGFIVSRVDGVMDIRSVIQISPASEYETLLIFRRLLAADVIDLTGTGEIRPRRD